jgi:hypothetical protein
MPTIKRWSRPTFGPSSLRTAQFAADSSSSVESAGFLFPERPQFSCQNECSRFSRADSGSPMQYSRRFIRSTELFSWRFSAPRPIVTISHTRCIASYSQQRTAVDLPTSQPVLSASLPEGGQIGRPFVRGFNGGLPCIGTGVHCELLIKNRITTCGQSAPKLVKLLRYHLCFLSPEMLCNSLCFSLEFFVQDLVFVTVRI